jgi:hypothetical protein
MRAALAQKQNFYNWKANDWGKIRQSPRFAGLNLIRDLGYTYIR